MDDAGLEFDDLLSLGSVVFAGEITFNHSEAKIDLKNVPSLSSVRLEQNTYQQVQGYLPMQAPFGSGCSVTDRDDMTYPC
eukprot:COSAG06_NODE_8172_length_2251_cov_1.114312_1_plen_80_part_00